MRLVPDLSPVGWFLFGAMVLLIFTYLYFWWMMIKASAHKHVSREKVTSLNRPRFCAAPMRGAALF